MWLLNRSDVNLPTQAHSKCHPVSANADWFKAAPVVLHLTWYHAYWVKDNVAVERGQTLLRSEFLGRVNYGSGLPGYHMPGHWWEELIKWRYTILILIPICHQFWTWTCSWFPSLLGISASYNPTSENLNYPFKTQIPAKLNSFSSALAVLCAQA